MRSIPIGSISASAAHPAAARSIHLHCDATAARSRRRTTSPSNCSSCFAFLHGGFRPDHAFSRIELSPAMPGAPEVWLLGSSMWSAAAAAQLGLPAAFAHFIDPTHTRAAIEYYRSHFRPSNELSAPVAILGIGAISAPTDEEAQGMASSVRLFVRHARQGMRDRFPRPSKRSRSSVPGRFPTT